MVRKLKGLGEGAGFCPFLLTKHTYSKRNRFYKYYFFMIVKNSKINNNNILLL